MKEELKNIIMGYMKITMENLDMDSRDIEDVMWEFEHHTIDMYTDEDALRAVGKQNNSHLFL